MRDPVPAGASCTASGPGLWGTGAGDGAARQDEKRLGQDRLDKAEGSCWRSREWRSVILIPYG